jgi:antitoxin (DNA-binding transcriptional repressor) of toxin-antitoxin stability system
MTRISVKDAEKDLSAVIKRVREGEDIVLVDDESAIRLSTIEKSSKRRAGALRDTLVVPARLLEPMSDDELREFWGGEAL